MTVHFIGVGPGAVDLLTVRGKELLTSCPICMYAGSLISKRILNLCPKNAIIKNDKRIIPKYLKFDFKFNICLV